MERRILIGLITSDAYVRKIRQIWNPALIESNTARIIGSWAMEFFDEYDKPIGAQLETIFLKKVQDGMDDELAEEIEEDILPDLSDQAVDEGFDADSMIMETLKYFNTRNYQIHSDQVNNVLNGKGVLEDRLADVNAITAAFKPLQFFNDESIDLSKKSVLLNIEKAFASVAKPVVSFPKELGEFWNDKFIAGGFISFLAPEKRGKTFRLLDIGMRAVKQGKNVAFFQAGDMNEGEQLKRIVIYETKRNTIDKYCGEHFQPCRDCRKNQEDTCGKDERECSEELFFDGQDERLDELTMAELIEAYNENPDHKTCYNCDEYKTGKLGVPWIKKIAAVDPIEVDEAKQRIEENYVNKNRRFKLSTHANGTLSTDIMEQVLDEWENEDGFVADLILCDYVDIMLASIKAEFRHQENQKWKDLRRLSQTPRKGVLPLVVAPTQADALSYKAKRLKLENFSEDKRKYGHVTAMYGLNQDPDGREKGLGLMIINELIAREGEFDSSNEITVLQDLWQGRPLIGSFY